MEWTTTEDEYGIYKTRTNEHGITETLTTRKQKWVDENPPQESEPLPVPLEKRVEKVEEESFNTMVAVAEVFEESIKNETENLDTMIAISEVYEIILDLQSQIDTLKQNQGTV